jgi:hypothetical protein
MADVAGSELRQDIAALARRLLAAIRRGELQAPRRLTFDSFGYSVGAGQQSMSPWLVS